MSKDLKSTPIRKNPRMGRIEDTDASVVIGGAIPDIIRENVDSGTLRSYKVPKVGRRRDESGTTTEHKVPKVGRKRDERIRFTARKRVKLILNDVKEDWNISTFINQAIIYYKTSFVDKK